MTIAIRNTFIAGIILIAGMFFCTAQVHALEAQMITTDKNTYTVLYEDSFNLNAQAKTSLTYSSGNTTVAEVNGQGQVTAKQPGTARIFIKAAKSDIYKPAQKIVTVNVKKGTVTLKIDKSAEGWNYLMGRQVTLWQKVNGKYTKRETKELGDGGIAQFTNLPAGNYFWAETLQDDDATKYINEGLFKTKAMVSEKYGTVKRLTKLHPLTYNKVTQ